MTYDLSLYRLEKLPRQEKWHTLIGSSFNLLGIEKDDYEIVDNCLAIGDKGLIVDSNSKLIDRLHNEHVYWSPKPFPFSSCRTPSQRATEVQHRLFCLRKESSDLVEQLSKKEVISIHEPCIYLAHPFGWYAFGHLHDTLQRLYNIPREYLLKYKFLVSKSHRVVDFCDHLSIACGRKVTPDDCILLDKGVIISFDKLIVANSPSMPTNYTPRTYSLMVTSYLKWAFEDLAGFEKIDFLYLSRNHVRPGKRSVLNESQIIDFLAECGKCKVVTGKESLKELIRLFNLANTIVGAHGSLFANTIYCNPGSTVIEYCPDNRIDLSFKNKYKATMNYVHQLVNADANFNIKIPLPHLKKMFLPGVGL